MRAHRSGILPHGRDFSQVAWLLNTNERLKDRTDAEWGAAQSGKAFQTALAKARDHGFFLGMDDSWMDT